MGSRENYGQSQLYFKKEKTRTGNEEYISSLNNTDPNEELQNKDRDFNQQEDYNKRDRFTNIK